MTDTETGGLELPFPKNHAPLPSFKYIIGFLEQICEVSGVGSNFKRRQLITEFINQWRKDIGNDIYPAFQLFLPKIDDTLKQLQVKESTLSKQVVSSLHINPQSADAVLIMETTGVFNRSRFGNNNKSEDLGSKCETALANRKTNVEYSNWTLDKVFHMILTYSGSGKEKKQQVVDEIVNELSPKEVKWIIRILLRNLRIDCSEKTFLQCFHPNALDVYKVVSSLKLICSQLWDPEILLQQKDTLIRLYSCFKPMRAKFIPGVYDDLNKVVAKMDRHTSGDTPNGSFYVEEKVDGERIQLHYGDYGKKCQFFSRRGNDFSSLYGTSTESKGTITPYLKQYLSPTVESCILDGEMVAVDIETGEICSVSNVRQTAKIKGKKLQNVFLVFDCLYKNGNELSEYCLHHRKKVMESIFKKEPASHKSLKTAHIMILPYTMGNDQTHIKDALTKGINEMSEGLVIKNIFSKYILDGRNDAWIKVKPEFVNGYIGENFDLLLVGAYKGKGGNRTQYASYLCALKLQNTFLPLCRVGSGISSAMHQYIDDKISSEVFSSESVPDFLKIEGFKYKSNLRPDVYIKPEDSIVLEVKATQILETYGEYSLRFPRFVKVREDKACTNSLTLSDFLEYKKYLDSKFGDRSKNDKNDDNKKRKSSYIVGGSKLRKPEKKTMEKKSSLFDGIKFFITSDIDDPKYISAEDLTTIIVEHGGIETRNIDPTVIVIGDKKSPNVVSYMFKSGDDCRVIHPSWIFDCINTNEVLGFEPQHFFIGKKDYSLVDRYGFPLFRKITNEKVAEILSDMEPDEFRHSQLQMTLEYLFPMNETQTKSTLFAHMRVFVFNYDDIALQLLRYGSALITECKESATHLLYKNLPPSETHGCIPISSQQIRSLWIRV